MAVSDIKKSYFGAINSSVGFVSFFEDIFFSDNIKQRYIIKGGPGTGKSSFMKREAQRAQAEGRDVEYYYCSSDTSSLDGIVVDGSIAVFDGTAPHSYDTRLPGAVDKIINLGEYWSSELLVPHVMEISELGKRKSAAYSAAYGYLEAAGKLLECADRLILPCVNQEKLTRSAERLVGKGKGSQGQKLIRQSTAFGIYGKVQLDTLFDMAKKHILIDDHYGSAYLFLSEICRLALENGNKVYVSYDTVIPSKISEIYLPDTGEYFGESRADKKCENVNIINMKRFINADKLGAVRGQYRKARKMAEGIVELANNSLSLAGALHANIEKYYIISMDFERMRKDPSLSLF